MIRRSSRAQVKHGELHLLIGLTHMACRDGRRLPTAKIVTTTLDQSEMSQTHASTLKCFNRNLVLRRP